MKFNQHLIPNEKFVKKIDPQSSPVKKLSSRSPRKQQNDEVILDSP